MTIVKRILFLLIKVVFIKAEYVNVAEGKTTSQTGEKWPSKNAVDGIKYCPSVVNRTYYSLTEESKLPSWQLDLGDLFKIERINVYGRDGSHENQLQGFRLYLSSGVFNEQSTPVYTNTAADYNNGYINVTSFQAGLYRYVKLDVPDTYRNYYTNANKTKQPGPIVLCEVEVFVNAENIAVGKSVTMSQYLSAWDPSKAVDNSTSQNADDCHCCSHSSDIQQPWLTVNLGKQYYIIQIKVLGRTDDHRENRKLGGLQLFTNGSNDLLSNYAFNLSQSRNIIIFNPVNLSSQYVTLRRPGHGTEWYLVVCELQVFVRVCDHGTYGTRCDKKCGHCRKPPCNVETGFCFNKECLAGWHGDVCKTACTPGTFGPNCLLNCSAHCLNGVPECNKTTGNCNKGCEAGFMRDNCTEECNSGKFGPNCNSTCSDHCDQGMTQCSKTTGECKQGCDPGYTGRYCFTPCQSGRFGRNCSSYCSSNCLNGVSRCDKATGVCIQGCDAGFMGTNCSKGCTNGTYGANCAKNCSNNCLNGNAQCDQTTGDCKEGCIAGYLGSKCLSECLNGTFGVNCTRLCHCMDGIACNKIDGVCRNGCAFGWTGSDCSHDLSLISRIRETVTTKQSSTYLDNNSLKAIDGVEKYTVNTCKCCSVTQLDSPAWWQINLKQQFLISSLEIFGRQTGNNEQLENATIHASNITMEGNTSSGTCVYKVPSMVHARKFTVNLSTHIIAQYFKVQLLTGILTFCEFRLFEKECGVGSFGYGCAYHCHCLDRKPCNPITGYCNNTGCMAGWQGEACDKECNQQTFGDACNKTCHCIDGSPCEHIDGTCVKGECEPGWLPPTCSESWNLINSIKEQVTTYMSSDAGNSTSALAIDGRLGPDPDVCFCCSVTSNAPSSWWKLDLGKRYPLKSILIYGRNKEQSYQQLEGFKIFLMNSSTINVPAVNLHNESKPLASVNKYEITLHNVLTRYIKIQRPGVLTLCEVILLQGDCSIGTFGDECSHSCHCADYKPCDYHRGFCKSPICKIGWIGKSCNISCPTNTFGEGCSETCYCEHGTCSSDYGVCSGKCEMGFHGAHCNLDGDVQTEKSTQISDLIIGGSVGGACVVFVTLVILIYRFRIKPNRSDSKSEYTSPDLRMTALDESTYDTIDNTQDNSSNGNEGYVNESVMGM